jgi:sugar phosphate isomerase/epimerase
MTHTINRRTFLKCGAITLAAMPVLARQATIKVYHIPLHDVSVREQLTKDPAGTLAALANTGFRELEYTGENNAAYYGLPPGEFRKLLDDSPVSIPVGQLALRKTHWLASRNDVSDEWKIYMENALMVGQEYIISPGFDWNLNSPDEVKKGIEAYNRVGELMDEAGLRLGFHPTAREFGAKQRGKPVYETLLHQMDSLYVCQQLDLGLLARLGLDPVAWLRMNPHHFESLHIQDYIKGEATGLPLGSGTLPLDDILAFARKNTPVKYWVIVANLTGGDTPWKAIGSDLQRFRQYGFV